MGDDFWTTDFDGTTPEDELNEIAFYALSKDKIIQQIAVSYKITAPLNFTEFEKAWRESNKKSDNEIAYGPENVRMYEYLQYLMTQTKDELKTYLAENVWTPTEEDLRNAFYSLDEEIRMTDFILSGYEFTWEGEKSPAKDIEIAIKNGLSPQDAATSLLSEYPTLMCKELELDTSQIHKEDVPSAVKINHFTHAEQNSFIAPEGINECYYVIDLEGGWLEYEDAPGYGYNKWVNDSFDELVNSTLEKAKIKK